MAENRKAPYERCDDSRCKERASQLIMNDIGEAKMRFCLDHAIAWSSTNKRQSWTVKELTYAETAALEVSRGSRELDGKQHMRRDSRADPTQPGDQPGLFAPSRAGGGDGRLLEIPGRVEQPSELAPRDGDNPSSEHRLTRTDSPDRFRGAGTVELTDAQCALLLAPVNPDLIDIRPDGLIYLPQIHYRKILNMTFRPGGWALVPQGSPMVEDQRIVVHYYLYVGGKYVGESLGSMAYYAKSAGAKWDDCVEGAKSDALTRICKDLGIASECWDWRFGQEWKAKYAIQINVQGTQGAKRQWRRLDKEPFSGESKPGRQSQGEYYRHPTVQDENDAHIDSIRGEVR